jgi:hypothetical protein
MRTLAGTARPDSIIEENLPPTRRSSLVYNGSQNLVEMEP